MADPSPSPIPQVSSNPNPNPKPNPTLIPNLNPPPPDSPPNSTQPPSSTPTPLAQPSINPNPTTAPFPPLQISPYTVAQPYRPAGALTSMPVPQFTPIPQDPNVSGFPAQPNQGFLPPGVTSAMPQQQSVVAGQVGQPPLRPPYMAVPNGYMGIAPQGPLPPGVFRYPYPPVRPPFLRPGVPVGTVPPLTRPFMGLRPHVITPVVRPAILPIILPAEKPQTTVYVGKIAPSVDNDFIRSLLEVSMWTCKELEAFCEFESAEGVLRALRLLNKCNVDGVELVLNVNQATREYLERYVKKNENVNKSSENGAKDVKKEEESTSEGEKVEGIVEKEPVEDGAVEPNKETETEIKEIDAACFGLVTEEDRDADRQASEKLTSMIEEFIKTKPPLPPPPPTRKVSDGTDTSNFELTFESEDKDFDNVSVKNEEKNDDETTSETKSTNRAGTVSPDRSRRNDSWNRDRERDRERQVKERELDRLERERERLRARRENERELEIQKVERVYKERVKEWESREKEKEYERKREREKEKERERERRRLIAEQEDDSDDDSRKRRRKSEVEDKRRRRKREKEEDLADRLKEEDELVEAKKRKEAEEEQRTQRERRALDLLSVPLANGDEMPVLPETIANEIKDDMMVQDLGTDSARPSHIGDEKAENGTSDKPMIASGSTSDVKMDNAPAKKLGFGLVGSGKRTTVMSVFHEEAEDDAQREKKMRPLVPIDYSTEELQAVHINGEAPVSVVSIESGKRVNPRDAKSYAERDRSRRSHGRAP